MGKEERWSRSLAKAAAAASVLAVLSGCAGHKPDSPDLDRLHRQVEDVRKSVDKIDQPVGETDAQRRKRLGVEPKEEAGWLVKLERRGGLCLYGPCVDEVVIEENGAYVWSESPSSRRRGAIDGKDLARLAETIAGTDFAGIKAAKFTGTCPSAYDGAELVYIFNTAHGVETISACAYAIDDGLPVFEQIGGLDKKIRVQAP